jgi:hypothetical protein
LSLWVLAFSFVHSREPDVLEKLQAPDAILAAVNTFADKLGATNDELTAAIEKLLPENKLTKDDKFCPSCGRIEYAEPDIMSSHNPAAWDVTVAALSEQFPGIERQALLWVEPDSYVAALIQVNKIKNDAEAGTPSSASPQMVATHNLMCAVKSIRERHRLKQEGSL